MCTKHTNWWCSEGGSTDGLRAATSTRTRSRLEDLPKDMHDVISCIRGRVGDVGGPRMRFGHEFGFSPRGRRGAEETRPTSLFRRQKTCMGQDGPGQGSVRGPTCLPTTLKSACCARCDNTLNNDHHRQVDVSNKLCPWYERLFWDIVRRHLTPVGVRDRFYALRNFAWIGGEPRWWEPP